jgi:hypothetical protein
MSYWWAALVYLAPALVLGLILWKNRDLLK